MTVVSTAISFNAAARKRGKIKTQLIKCGREGEGMQDEGVCWGWGWGVGVGGGGEVCCISPSDAVNQKRWVNK